MTSLDPGDRKKNLLHRVPHNNLLAANSLAKMYSPLPLPSVTERDKPSKSNQNRERAHPWYIANI